MQKIEIKDLKNLSWKSWFMLVTLLLAAGLGGGTVNVMLNVQGEVAIIKDSLQHEINSTFYGLQKSCSYLVSTVISGATTYYTMQNGTTGALAAYGTNASQIINWAIGNLTSGRTWQETVCLKGNLSIDSTILVRNYTRVLVEGQVSTTYDPSFDIFRNYDYPSASICIAIEGVATHSVGSDSVQATLNGNRGAAYKEAHGINFGGSSSNNFITIKNLVIDNVNGAAINVSGSLYKIDNVVAGYDCWGDGMYLFILSDSYITNCYAGGNDMGFYLAGGGSNVIDNLYCGNAGIGSANCVIGGNNGLYSNIRVDSVQATYAGLLVVGSNCYNNQFTNIHISRPLTAKPALRLEQAVVNNSFVNVFIGQKGDADDTAVGWTYGILVGSWGGTVTPHNNRFVSFTINNCTTATSGLNTTVGYADQLDLSTIQIGGKPLETLVSSTNTTTTTFVFNHGLAGTPTFIFCSFNFTGWTSWTWTATSTQVTITITGTLPAAMKCYCEVKHVP